MREYKMNYSTIWKKKKKQNNQRIQEPSIPQTKHAFFFWVDKIVVQ